GHQKGLFCDCLEDFEGTMGAESLASCNAKGLLVSSFAKSLARKGLSGAVAPVRLAYTVAKCSKVSAGSPLLRHTSIASCVSSIARPKAWVAWISRGLRSCATSNPRLIGRFAV